MKPWPNFTQNLSSLLWKTSKLSCSLTCLHFSSRYSTILQQCFHIARENLFFFYIVWTNVSQTGFRRTLRFQSISLGVPREIAESLHNYLVVLHNMINMPRNIAEILVRRLRILELSPSANNRLFISFIIIFFFFIFVGRGSSRYEQLL
jgi:hypothetical protein